MRKLLILLIAGLMYPTAASADMDGYGKVVAANAVLMGTTTIRLWGIEPPPPGSVCVIDGTTDNCRVLARQMLRELTQQHPIYCEEVAHEADHYVSGRCTLSPADLGSLLVNAGLARDNRAESGGIYTFAESNARARGRGLWAQVPQPASAEAE